MTAATMLDDGSPPILEYRKAVYEYYQLTFDQSGCPMKRTGDGLVFHPILAPYLIADYTSEFERTGDQIFLEHGHRIAAHALKRAETLEESLVFMYQPNTGLSNVPTAFYSGLTQAWYVKALCLLEKQSPGFYADAIRRIFASLMIPVERSGVLMKKDYGWIVEEYPHEPAFYTLNGWLTVLRWVVQSRDVLDLLAIPYRDFLEHNLDAVVRLLPMYDAPTCLNSRYQLTGFSRVKIVFDRVVDHRCLDFAVDIPGEGCFRGDVVHGKKSRWENHLERSEPRLLQFNVLLSLISKPEKNVFRACLEVDKECRAKIFLAQGEYRPDSSGMPTESWKLLREVAVGSGEVTEIECPIPFDGVDLFAYPTNFKKKIGDLSYNGYHFVHIVDLAELYGYSRRAVLKDVAEKWLAYYEGWSDLPYLKGDKYSLLPHLYGSDFPAVVRRLLR